MKRLITICAVATIVLAMNGTASGYFVRLSQWMDGDGEISYSFSAFANFSGTVTTPLGEILVLDASNTDTSYQEPTLSELIARFPDGTYTFDDGANSYLAVVDGPFPGEFPNITSTIFDSDGDLTITWDPWTTDKSYPRIDITVGWPDGNYRYNTTLDASSTQHTIPASLVPPLQLPMDVNVGFRNAPADDSGWDAWHSDKWKNRVIWVPEPATLAGDFDADNDVDGIDFGLWQTGYPMASGATLSDGDADADGDVDGIDFGLWQENYPTNLGGAVTIPEPATLGILLMGGLALLKRRR